MYAIADRQFRRTTRLVWFAGLLAVVALGADLVGRPFSGWLTRGLLAVTPLAWGIVLVLRSRLRTELLRQDAGYIGMFEGHPQPIVLADRATLEIVGVNRAARDKYGYSDVEFSGLTVFDLHRAEDRDDVRLGWSDLGDTAGKARSVGRHVTKEGDTFAAEVLSTTLEIDGRAVRMNVVFDVGERDEALEAAREQGARYRQMVEVAHEGVVTVDTEVMITEVSNRASSMLGYANDELVGHSITDLAGPQWTEAAATETSEWTQSGTRGERETVLQAKDGTMVPVQIRGDQLVDRAGDFAGQLGMITDLTEQRALEDEIQFNAIHDSLTGLPNRLLLVDRVERALERATTAGHDVIVVLVGLDDFKRVNSTYGQDVGDRLLVQIADRLSASITGHDTVARLGGDEFVVVSEQPGAQALDLAAILRAAVAEPDAAGAGSWNPTASIGVSVGRRGDRAASLLRDADIALLHAKAEGGDRVVLATDALRATSRERLLLGSELRRALDQGEFSLCFQPVVSLADRTVLGAEALLRWNHPRRGRLSPDAFIAVAEQTGLIVPIGTWVLNEACRQLLTWQRLSPSFTMSVNMSGTQFVGDSLDAIVRDAMTTSGVEPSQLVVEITENVLMDDVQLSASALAALRAAGVKIAIDDFGTGYSSLAYLKKFPIDILKIDQSFVAGLPTDAYDWALITAVIAVADSLGLEITAEGVETEEQAAALLVMGCPKAQGYLFNRPLDAVDFEAALLSSLDTTS